MADVFISYDAPVDRAKASRLAAWLEQHGRTVWWDRELLAGMNFCDVLEKELETAKAVVVIWTPTSCRSGWVRREAINALARGVLVPVLVGLDVPPLGFQGVETLRWEDPDSDVLELMLAIDGLCEAA